MAFRRSGVRIPSAPLFHLSELFGINGLRLYLLQQNIYHMPLVTVPQIPQLPK